jgi:outer membrane biosynthesis protein TonB
MIDVQQKKNKIIAFLKENGPSLPVRIAKVIDMAPMFASAILSELLGEKSVKTSNLRVGASPLYLLPGQEQRLEEHADNLKPVEKEAYLRLKEKKVLRDENETPVMRVALKGIKDFAVQMNNGDQIIWRYAFISDEEADDILNRRAKKEEPKKEDQPEVMEDEPKKEKIEKPKKEKKKIEKLPVEKEKIDEETDFQEEVREFLSKKKLEVLKEIESSKKEIVATIRVRSNLGDLDFLLVAKNKKTTNEEELQQALQRASHEQMPCLYLIKKEPSKKVLSSIESNKLIRIEVLS